ncbi:MAG: alkaline phosphatase [Sphingomonadaceae bacterium]|nr:alkaline phosphatase [Sphingomonadaceae bacterium]
MLRAGILAVLWLAACAPAAPPSGPAPAPAPSGGPAAAPAPSGAAPAALAATGRPTSVILFITDGASYETWNIAGYWARGERDGAPWSAWPVRLGMTTYPLNTERRPQHSGRPRVGYDPVRAWDTTLIAADDPPQPPAMPGAPARRYPSPFAGYRWLKSDYTDSAAAGTALASGIKTYNNAISVDDFGRPVPLVTETAKAQGFATGVVTSVPFTHATPAVFGANVTERDAYHEIGRQMLRGERLDVVAGAGHPDFDDDGRPRTRPDFTWVAPNDWADLKAGRLGRTLFESTAEIRALAEGRGVPPGRLAIVPRVGSTLQFRRDAKVAGPDPANPSGAAFTRGLPDLSLLTLAALERLGREPKGFFLMVEGGAVDWAAHANDTGRLIEEQLDFERAVAAASRWLARRGRLDRTLLIVLTDHGNGLPLGPESDRIAFQPVVNHGQGRLPGVRWHSGTHTNENTRLWATGPYARCLERWVVLRDPGLADIVRHNADGATIDNTAIAPVMRAALTGGPCPDPGR